jgi:hypothetical protein
VPISIKYWVESNMYFKDFAIKIKIISYSRHLVGENNNNISIQCFLFRISDDTIYQYYAVLNTFI